MNRITMYGTLLFIVALALITSGHCQTASVTPGPANGPTVVMTEHPQHADVKSLQTDGATTTASGTRPLSDFYTEPKREIPLGDVARYYRTHKYVPLEVKR
jgi:hypothetical protein